MEQVASVGQITELTLTGRSWTKGSMAVQSARPGHDYQVIMGPGSREGPGTRYAGRTQRRKYPAASQSIMDGVQCSVDEGLRTQPEANLLAEPFLVAVTS